MQKFEAVLFDIDGTLLDTFEFIFQAYEHTLGKHGLVPKNRSEVSALIGISLESVYEALAPGADVRVLSKTHREFQADNLHLTKPFPGAIDTLELLKSSGLKVAAVTTRSRLTVLETLKVAKIATYIDYVVALEDVVHLKPHPEPVLKALEYLDVGPEDGVMVGDTDVDVLAGKNAGTVTVGVTYGFHGAKIAESKPDYIINSIDEIIPVLLPELTDSVPSDEAAVDHNPLLARRSSIRVW